MKIETKYNIGELVQHKFQKSTLLSHKDVDVISFYEITGVRTSSVNESTEIYYRVQPFTKFIVDYTKEKEVLDFSPQHIKGEIFMREEDIKECNAEIQNAALKNASR